MKMRRRAMLIKRRSLLAGIRSFNPFFRMQDMGGGTLSARYCYSVWMRHLSVLAAVGLEFEGVVAELGPGDSLGVGIAALLSGASAYRAFDAVEYQPREENLRVFDELVELFRSRTSIPDNVEFPQVRPQLDSYAFPSKVLNKEHMARCLDPTRLRAIRADIVQNQGSVQYVAPWDDPRHLAAGSVDLILSQAVLEHVEDVDKTYRAMTSWLKVGGAMSHVIDYRCHGISEIWNAQWALGDFQWWLVRGKRPFFLNREPHSVHLWFHTQSGFALRHEHLDSREYGVGRGCLASRFVQLTDQDLCTRGSHLISVKEEA